MIFIEIFAEYKEYVSAPILERAAHTTLHHQSSEGDLTIVITTNDEIRALNHQHRGFDAVTDVLSFEAGYADPETGRIYLGDVVIAYPQAETQAAKNNHPLAAELQLLVVHGVLHLLGHDHANLEEKSTMWQVQGEILSQLGLDNLKFAS